MSQESSCGNLSEDQIPSKLHLQTSQTMSLAKTLHVQDQIIEQLRSDQAILREALDSERITLRECRVTFDKELKALQRENIQTNKTVKQQEVKIEELEKALAFAKDALACEQNNLKSLEKEHINTVKELKLKNSREYERSNKQEMIIDQLRSEIEDLREALESERNATNLLIKEHNSEVKMLREEVRAKSTEAYRDLKERAIRERDEYREMQEEAEKMYKVLEKDFRDALAAKDEELKKVKTESRLIQKELEDQLRSCLREPTHHLNTTGSVRSGGHHDFLNYDKMRKLKSEVRILREQNRKLLNELELLTTEEKLNEIKKQHYFIPFSFQTPSDDSTNVKGNESKADNQAEVLTNADRASRTEINRLLGEMRSKNRTIRNLQRDLSLSKQTIEKVRRVHDEELERIRRQCREALAKRPKPMLPIKRMKLVFENAENQRNHVKDMVRRLQERQNAGDGPKNSNFAKPVKNGKNSNIPEDGGNQSPNQTLEDLKAIDEDIEKLRKQIEERDKIISALREAAEAKDKKLDQMMTEYSKMQSERAVIQEPECRTSTNGGDPRVQERNMAAFSASPSPPLCSGELCWTDGFVNKNYHEPVYAQLLSDHTALQKIYNELREKLESRKGFEIDENQNFPRKAETYENGINLIMAEQIRILKEREAQLMSEAEELREQNDLMEFRILELEECRKEEIINEHKNRSEKSIWPERDLEDVSDSGVMSLPTSEDLTSDSELSDTFRNYLQADSAIVPTLFPKIQIVGNDSSPNDLKQKRILKSAECLQESGIFEDSETASDGGSNHSSLLSGSECSTKQTKASQTESILDKALLEIIESSCDLILTKNKNHIEDKQSTSKPDDLTTEISKLSEIQKRIQQKRDNVCESISQKSSLSQPYSCPHSNTVVFYERRLGQLEDKLKIYESSDETKDVLLKKRLEKEIELSHKVKELSDRVANLEEINKRIEEERCEFEEAENDSRFQCQRLEIKVQELMEKNSELELELERRKMMMAGEKPEMHRKKTMGRGQKKMEGNLSMIEAAIPAILAWNIFCLNQTKNEISEHLQSDAFALEEKDLSEMNKPIAYPDEEVFRKLEELMNDQRKLRIEYEKAEEEARQREVSLKRKIEDLERKSARDREILGEMTMYLKALKGEDGVSRSECSESSPPTEEFEMIEEFKFIAENDIKMRRKIEVLEHREQAYLQTLQQVDEIWANSEAEYKAKLSESEKIVQRLWNRVNELEQRETETNQALTNESTKRDEAEKRIEELALENKQLKNHIKDLPSAENKEQMKMLENENAKLKDMVKSMSERLPLERKKSELLRMELRVQKEQGNKDKLTIEKLRRNLEERQSDLEKKENTFQAQISDLTQEISTKSKEISNLEVTVAELREEVETLENKVAELVQALQNTKFGFQDENIKASSAQAEVEPRWIHQAENTLCSATGAVTGISSSPPKRIPEKPLMKVARVTCPDFDECDDDVQVLRDVKKIEVPNSIATQLLQDKTETNRQNRRMGDHSSQDFPKSKRTVLKADESFFSTASESEVSLHTGVRKFEIQEISSKAELQQPNIQPPYPKPKPPTEIYVLIPENNSEIVFRHPSSLPKEKILVRYANSSINTRFSSPEEPSKPTLNVVEETQTALWKDEREAHISELTMSNLTLQKTLEKIEEESKLKDLELTKLQKVVTEIRKEQNELEDKILEMSNSFSRESKATEIDLSVIRSENWNQTEPVNDSRDVKEDDDGDEEFEDVEDEMGGVSTPLQAIEENAEKQAKKNCLPMGMRDMNIFQFNSLFAQKAQQMSSLSNLQVALDNLPNKNRIKNAIFRALTQELESKEKTGRHCDSDNFSVFSDFGSEANLFCVDSCDVFCPPNNSFKASKQNPKKLPPQIFPSKTRRESEEKLHPRLKSISLDQAVTHKSNADIDFATPIKILRKIGNDSLFMEWQTDLQPSSVTGFEICVNGNLQHRVHSATRNKALLKNFDFTRKNTISLYTLSAKGRSVKCTSTIFP